MGEAVYEGWCCFIQFCLIPSPLCFPFSLFSLVISDDSTDIYTQIVRGFFTDNNWKMFLDFFL